MSAKIGVKCVWIPWHKCFAVVSRFDTEGFCKTAPDCHSFTEAHEMEIKWWEEMIDRKTSVRLEGFSI